MIDNLFGYCVGRMMSPKLHWWFSKLTGWMFAAVWIRNEQRHVWMWVHEKRYYSGELQTIAARKGGAE